MKSGEYSLFYQDADGDEITAEIEEDFEVAKVTMIEEQDLLQFWLTVKDGFKPTIKKIIKVKPEKVKSKPN